jgi:hypothetical protein
MVAALCSAIGSHIPLLDIASSSLELGMLGGFPYFC